MTIKPPIRFTSEPGIIIEADRFKLETKRFFDNDEEFVCEVAWGKEAGFSAWFQVPPKERKRLEKIGVLFEREQRR